MKHMRIIWSCFNFICIACLLAACAAPLADPTPTPTASAGASMLVADLMQSGAAGGPAVLVGYLYADGQRTVLAPGLSHRPNAPPRPLPDAASHQVWLGAAPEPAIEPDLRQQENVRYALVQVEGQLDGPGTFGPDGLYPYQMHPAAYLILTPLPVTLSTLTADESLYEGQYVRVEGVLLASDDSLLLVDAVGEGGVPAPGSTPIKLVWLLRDRYVLERLSQPASSQVRFGAVGAVGIWRDGTLWALSLTLRE
jgi:hypothetical protein